MNAHYQFVQRLITSEVVHLRCFQKVKHVEQCLGLQRGIDPQAVPAWLRDWKSAGQFESRIGRIVCLFDRLVHDGRIRRQRDNAVAACQRACPIGRQCVGRAIAARLFDHRRAAKDRQRLFHPKAIGRIDGKAFEDAALSAGIAEGPGRAKLPLRPFRVAAILKPADRASMLQRPDEEFGGFHPLFPAVTRGAITTQAL
jgi:hypothetical protein